MSAAECTMTEGGTAIGRDGDRQTAVQASASILAQSGTNYVTFVSRSQHEHAL
ncbi:MAG: hypothetical protein ACI8XM_000863 [Haloarculaceae archaeon]|jgi:hypothetical protein